MINLVILIDDNLVIVANIAKTEAEMLTNNGIRTFIKYVCIKYSFILFLLWTLILGFFYALY